MAFSHLIFSNKFFDLPITTGIHTQFSTAFCEGLPGVLGNKGTLAKYRREQGNISQFLGTGNKISKNYSTKTF